MKLSEAFWIAANEHLWDGRGAYASGRAGNGWQYSCDAVMQGPLLGDDAAAGKAKKFLRRLGCSYARFDYFSGVENEAAQGARYAWLMFASMYASELEEKGEL